MTPAIRVEDLSKCYRVNHAEERLPYRTLRDTLARVAKAPIRRWRVGGHVGVVEQFWALKDVSFDVQPGEVVGIIGRNGAGKSTLLKILSQITKPTCGQVTLRGRVGSLLEVGTGFHPELTGRENVYMNGSILGMSRQEIRRNFDEIVDFSGVEKFLDTPVKRYSSGMQVRLAFAVAAHLDPEMLLIDEVLAVGDAEFQKKCLGKMKDVARGGRTVLFVSHNLPAIRSLTSVCAFFKEGALKYFGRTVDTIGTYQADYTRTAVADYANLNYFRRAANNGSPVRFSRIKFEGGTERENDIRVVRSGDGIAVRVILTADRSIPSVCLSLTLIKDDETVVGTAFSLDQESSFNLQPGDNVVICRLPNIPLTAGRYTINAGVNQNAQTVAFDVIIDYPVFEVVIPELYDGRLDWAHRPWGIVHMKDVLWEMVR